MEKGESSWTSGDIYIEGTKEKATKDLKQYIVANLPELEELLMQNPPRGRLLKAHQIVITVRLVRRPREDQTFTTPDTISTPVNYDPSTKLYRCDRCLHEWSGPGYTPPDGICPNCGVGVDAGNFIRERP